MVALRSCSSGCRDRVDLIDVRLFLVLSGAVTGRAGGMVSYDKGMDGRGALRGSVVVTASNLASIASISVWWIGDRGEGS